MTSPKLLATTCLATTLLPVAAIAQPLGADDYLLHGLVRDMRTGHPDFTDVSPDTYVRIAGLTAPEISGSFLTLSTDGGTEVTAPARDSAGNVIPPHLAVEPAPPSGGGTGSGGGLTGVSSESPVILQDRWETDSWAISLKSLTYNPDGSSTWVYHVEELPGGRDLSHWNLELDPSHVVMPGTTAGYERGRDGSTGFVGIKWDVGDGFSSGDFVIVLDKWYEAGVWPDNVLAKGGPGYDTDEILAPGTGVSSPDPDPDPTGPETCLDLADTLAEYGLPHDGDIDSVTFQTWFNTTMWSKAVARSLIMRWNADTQSWRYRSEDFRPIDGDLYSAHLPGERNGSFTMVIDAAFEFEACTDRFIELAADGDAWVYINGKLAIDMGGMLRGDRQLLQLDRLAGLETGTDHRMIIYFAHRSEEAAHFEIHTNLHLRTFSSGFSVAPLAD